MDAGKNRWAATGLDYCCLRITLRPGARNCRTAASISASSCQGNLRVTATSTIRGLPFFQPSPYHSSNFSAYFFNAAKLKAALKTSSVGVEPGTLTKENPLECSGAPIETECWFRSESVADLAVLISSTVFARAAPPRSNSAIAQSVLYID